MDKDDTTIHVTPNLNQANPPSFDTAPTEETARHRRREVYVIHVEVSVG